MSSTGPVFFICLMARLLRDRRHIAVGSNSPIPAAASLLARAASGQRTEISILGSRSHNAFKGLAELFDCASQGRLDAFFLSPGQIDAQANINMVGVGDYPQLRVRWPGSHGSPLLYMMVPNVILFREEHSRRVLVPNVDFVSATGVSPPNVHRPGGPTALVTGKARFSFDAGRERFRLESVHPGITVRDVIENTGFDFDRQEDVPVTEGPDLASVELLLDKVSGEVSEMYPQFSETLREEAAAALEALSREGRAERSASSTAS